MICSFKSSYYTLLIKLQKSRYAILFFRNIFLSFLLFSQCSVHTHDSSNNNNSKIINNLQNVPYLEKNSNSNNISVNQKSDVKKIDKVDIHKIQLSGDIVDTFVMTIDKKLYVLAVVINNNKRIISCYEFAHGINKRYMIKLIFAKTLSKDSHIVFPSYSSELPNHDLNSSKSSEIYIGINNKLIKLDIKTGKMRKIFEFSSEIIQICDFIKTNSIIAVRSSNNVSYIAQIKQNNEFSLLWMHQGYPEKFICKNSHSFKVVNIKNQQLCVIASNHLLYFIKNGYDLCVKNEMHDKCSECKYLNLHLYHYENHIICLSKNGNLIAYDYDGQKVWSNVLFNLYDKFVIWNNFAFCKKGRYVLILNMNDGSIIKKFMLSRFGCKNVHMVVMHDDNRAADELWIFVKKNSDIDLLKANFNFDVQIRQIDVDLYNPISFSSKHFKGIVSANKNIIAVISLN